VRILAHRGAPRSEHQENTIAAVTSALDAGADGVEVDLRLSADGVLVLSHDPDLGRLSGLSLPVADTPWEQLRAAADARGLALARVEWLLAAAAGRAVVLELKSPPPAPGARARTAAALLDRLGVLHAAGLPLAVTVSSFDARLLAELRTGAPAQLRIRTALLGMPGRRPASLLRAALAAGHEEVHPHVVDVVGAPRAVSAAHACGVAMVPWTVNGPRAIRRCADLGVDGLITDVPVIAAAALLHRSAA
jgi:glycerophosphoryl diester phosphodiesterase